MTRSSAFLPVALILANLSALAVSVAVPLLVSADQYSIFALCWSVGQLTASLAFEWMRIGVLRYAVGADTEMAERRRATLWQGYAVITSLLLVGAVLSWAITPIFPYAGIIAAIAFYAACQGAFEGRQALARAHLHNGYYSAAWVLRTFISLLLAVLAAWVTGNGAMALLGLAASYPITLLIMNGLRRLPAVSRTLDRPQIGFLARYGFFAALASIASLLLAALFRTAAIALLGLDQAGGMLLAVDLSQKAIMVVGLAVNIIMMQESFRAAEFGNPEELGNQLSRHVAVTAALVAPAALGFLLIQEPFMALFVPAEYEVTYGASIAWACLAGGVLAFRQFGIDTLYATLEKTSQGIVGPAATILFFIGASATLGIINAASVQTLLAALAGSMVAGLLVSLALVTTARQVRWPLSDLAIVGVGCVAMFAASYLLPRGGHVVDLLRDLVVYGIVYCCVTVAANLAGLRSLLVTLAKRAARREV